MSLMKIRMEKYEIEENVKSLIYPRKEGSDSKYLEYDKVVFLLLFLFFVLEYGKVLRNILDILKGLDPIV